MPLGPDTPHAFQSVEVHDWRQFGSLSIQFHPRLTVLTGANGTGKSTVLNLLARHFNWTRAYSTTVTEVPRRNSVRWSALSAGRAQKFMESGNPWANIGTLTYGSGQVSEINVPAQMMTQREQYDVLLPNQQPVLGVYLTSYRSMSQNYSAVTQLPTLSPAAEQMLELFTNELRNRWVGQYTQKTPQLVFKESLLALAVFGPGNSSVEPNPEALRIWDGFNDILRSVMPKDLRFRKLRVRMPDLVIDTEGGEFLFDDASGGVSAVIEMSWQIFLRSRGSGHFTVLFDEPENHLHPSLQRDLLPNLLQAFPNVQFIVASHSPFVVTSTSESRVYALDYDSERRVQGRELDYINKAESADEILTSVLGLETTVPRWAQDRYERVVQQFLDAPLSEFRPENLSRELRAIGMDSSFLQAVADIDSRLQGDSE